MNIFISDEFPLHWYLIGAGAVCAILLVWFVVDMVWCHDDLCMQKRFFDVD